MSVAAEPRTDWEPFARPQGSRWALPAAILLLLALLVADVVLGPRDVPVKPGDVFATVLHHIPGLRAFARNPTPEDAATVEPIVWEIRLPRALTAALVGALLGYAGVALQGLLMNPLADPYTVGVSAGAAVGAALTEMLGLSALWMGFGSVAIAFAGAILTVLLIYALASVSGRVSVHTFLLAGVVVGTFLWSLIPLFLVLAHKEEFRTRILVYLLGSVQGADWLRVELLLPFAVLSAVSLRLWARELNLVTLGEETAAHLGVETERFKRRVLIVGSLATAATVSVCGIIGFVGLVVPHVARRLVGPDHRRLLPLAALFGAILLVCADTLVRAGFDDRLPVGVVTALIGAPFFSYLLRKRRAAAW